MKKLTLLVSEKDREATLVKLRKLGTIHIKSVSKPLAGEINLLEDKISHLKNAISIFNSYESGVAPFDKMRWSASEISDNVNEIISLALERADIETTVRDLENHIEWYKPWGAFNPQDLKALQEKKIFIKLYRVTKKAFKKIKERKDIYVVSADGQYVYIAQVCGGPEDALPLEEVKPAKESLEALSRRRESLRVRIEEIDGSIKNKARARDFLKEHLSTLESRLAFLNVMYGMGKERGFSYLQGFLPADRVKDIAALSKSEGLGYLVEEPDEPEKVPTLIRNPAWIRVISPVFKFMNTIPGYKEYDISLWFLIFFSLFFAMLIGDAGYGILFAAVTFFARKRMKKAPPEAFRLMYILSFATIIWGAITGTWFGAEKIAETAFINSLVIERISSFVGANQNFMIYMCFIIGVIHLSIAHLVITFRIINTLKAIAEIGWVLMLWGLFFTAGTLVISRPFPDFAGYLLIAGASFILLFSNPQRNIAKGILISLGNIPLKIVSSFADVVSYLRLFAVGYASVVLASTFNNMAIDIGFNSFVTSLGSAFILFFGHALNIILCIMAVIVHGLRLNMLEFSGQIGMEWSGKEYAPFREM